MEATLVKEEKSKSRHVRWYKLSEPITYNQEEGSQTRFIMASSISHIFAKETMVFPCNEKLKIISWLELTVVKKPGCFSEVLKDLGVSTIQNIITKKE